MRKPTTEIISSRGCPFNCIFCSIQTVWGRKWRARSAKNVVEEMELLYNKYGVREFRFFDDNISWDKKRMIEICDEIIKRKMDIRWDTPNGIAISTLDEQVLKKMKQAGYYKAIFGIESGCVDTLRKIRKPVSLDFSKRIIDRCNELGIWTWSTFVIGFPFEDENSIKQTMEYAKKSGLDFITVYIAQPYTGTEMYKMYEDMGLMKEGIKQGSSVVNTKYDTKYFKAEELSVWQKKIYSEFIRYKMRSYLNPITFYRNFLSKIRSFEDLYYVFRMSLNLAGRKYSPIYNKKKD
jgi:magnesium-protoporphyrin IX monomethyl ester (oxidative) cyclase